MKRITFGKNGEEIAVNFLVKNHFQILDRNFKIWGGEIDIVCFKDESFHFVEVKTRISEYWEEIEETINDKKLTFLEETANEWFIRKNIEETFWQIDFIGIILSRSNRVEKFVYLEDL